MGTAYQQIYFRAASGYQEALSLTHQGLTVGQATEPGIYRLVVHPSPMPIETDHELGRNYLSHGGITSLLLAVAK